MQAGVADERPEKTVRVPRAGGRSVRAVHSRAAWYHTLHQSPYERGTLYLSTTR